MRQSTATALGITSENDQYWQKTMHPMSARGTANLEVTQERFQSWRGFGGCFNELGWIALQRLAAADHNRVLDLLFKPRADGLRLSYCRLPIGASDFAAEWYSHNECAGDYAMRHFSIERDRRHLLPFIKSARERQPAMTLWASPWSPPTWMKAPKAYNYGTLIWSPANLRAYALYFEKFIRAYRREGVAIQSVHVQNEPCANQKFPSCCWTGAQLRDFIRDYLGPHFKKNKVPADIWLGTLNEPDYDGYPNLVLSDKDARQYIAGAGFQWNAKYALQRTWQSYPDVPLIQTENECGDGSNSWKFALYIHSLFRTFITNGVCAYVYWNMVLDAGGKSTWGWTQNSLFTVDSVTKKVKLQPEFYVMKHYARYIAPGAVRRGTQGQWSGNSVAFENPDGSVVVTLYNPFPDVRELQCRVQAGMVKTTLPPESLFTLVFPR